MKILVAVKRVPDYATKVRLKPTGDGIQTDGVQWGINPFDEIAVEEAVRIKEKLAGTTVTAVTIGGAQAMDQLGAALARGADRGVLIKTDSAVDSDLAARALAALAERESPDLIIMGKQAIDSDANQTGQLLAAILGLPQATFASKVVIEDGAKSAVVTREVDGGLETIKILLPAVITTDLRLNEPRYISLPNIVQAKKKPREEVELGSLGVDPQNKVRVVAMSAPPARKGGSKVGSVEELVQKLQNEAKVL